MGGPNFDAETGEIFESFSSPSGNDSDENSRINNAPQFEEPTVEANNLFNGSIISNQFTDSFVSNDVPISSSLDSFARAADPELMVLTQHIQEVEHRNQMYEEEISMLRNKVGTV